MPAKPQGNLALLRRAFSGAIGARFFSRGVSMERVIGFVDYGFLDKSACRPLKAKKLKPKAEGVIDWLRGIESGDPNSFLRAYWYDGAFDAQARTPPSAASTAVSGAVALLVLLA